MPFIFADKNISAPSVFLPAALLREARRQKGLATVDVPPVCILDPDGDIVRRLRQTGQSNLFEHWPCYHTELDRFLLGQTEVGIVGRAVGASFAVPIAEELFASGCRLGSTSRFVVAGPGRINRRDKWGRSSAHRFVCARRDPSASRPVAQHEQSVRSEAGPHARADGVRSRRSSEQFRFAQVHRPDGSARHHERHDLRRNVGN